jgi:hypothetical protein
MRAMSTIYAVDMETEHGYFPARFFLDREDAERFVEGGRARGLPLRVVEIDLPTLLAFFNHVLMEAVAVMAQIEAAREAAFVEAIASRRRDGGFDA